MGEVYRARDTHLNRDVALKVLPELFAVDAERIARFTREAQTLAALNHPNIAQIHGLERDTPSGRPHALVMELVEGEDLSAMIDRGAMPLDDALRSHAAPQAARKMSRARSKDAPPRHRRSACRDREDRRRSGRLRERPAAARRRRPREAIAWGVAATAIVAAVALVVMYKQRANAPSANVLRLAFVPPADGS